MSTVIEQAVEACLVADAPRMPTISATLHYDRSDPFAVRMTFPAPATLEGVEVCWTFARDLLTDGLEQAAGDGDVQVRPYGHDRTVLEFHAPEGTALVHVRTAKGTGRYIDLDRDLAELMRDAC